jgi:preprotein translocase subunit SecY
MAFCPNPDCKHKQRTGLPAEFRKGITTCRDCGTELVEENPEKPRERPPCPQPLRRRIRFTVAVACVLWLSMLIPPPFVDLDALGRIFNWSIIDSALHAGPLSRGPNPFLVAFILVELFALAVPRLRRRRHGDPALRGKLTRASVALGIGVSMLGAYSVAVFLEGAGWYTSGPPVVGNPGWAFRLSFVLATTAGTCLYVAAACLIHRFGVGSGFAVVILACMLSGAPPLFLDIWHHLAVQTVSPVQVLVLAAASVGGFAGTWWFLHLPDRKTKKLPLRLPTCGLFPLELAYLLMILPATLSQFFDVSWLTRLTGYLAPGTRQYLFTELALLLVFVPLISSLFYWRRRKAWASGDNLAVWRRALLHSAVFLLCIVGTWYAMYRLIPGAAWAFPSSVILVGACALFSDLANEIRARWQAPGGVDLVVVESHQDVADAVEAGRNRGLVVQGLHYRSLTYFFGPFVPLNILGEEKHS